LSSNALLQQRQRLVKAPALKSNTSVAHLTRVQQYFALTLLQQHQVAANNASLRDLTADEAKQLERICDALLQCKQQQPIQAASLRSALSKAQYSAYKAQTRAPTSNADVFDRKNRPEELTKYLAMLKVADLTNARADRAAASRIPRRIGNLSAAEHWRNKSETQYEHALEYLDETLGESNNQTEYEIRAWLDREFELSAESTISCDDGGVARVIGSRSKHCRVTVQTKKAAKQEKLATCAQDALQQAALQLIYTPPAEDVAQTLQLKAMLGKLKR
jgi:hypothetical protein